MHTSYTTSDSAAAVSFPRGGAGGPVLCTWVVLGFCTEFYNFFFFFFLYSFEYLGVFSLGCS